MDSMPKDQMLELLGCIGFSGEVPQAVVVHPNREHIMYPLGCNVVIENIAGKKKQTFLRGHTDFLTCITVSPNGKYIASGQKTHMGFEAEVIIWNFAELVESGFTKIEPYRRLKLHRVKVQDIAFSPNEDFLVSLGGEDDGKISFWDIESGKALCSAATGNCRAGFAECVAFCNNDNHTFVMGGNDSLRVWKFNPEVGKMDAKDVTVRGLRRLFKCIVVSEDDEVAYCGTKSGDIVAISLAQAALKMVGPERMNFAKGINAMALTADGNLVVGAADGTVALVKTSTWKVVKKVQLDAPVTSVAVRGQGHQFYVGTLASKIYTFAMADFQYEVRSAAHNSKVNDVCFPRQSSDLFGTCAGSEIRVWHTKSTKELLRIEVPNKVCNAFDFMPDGSAIVSGWDDGCIRAFAPESGKKICEVFDANGKGVTAIAPFNSLPKLITGGGDGQVRVWDLGSGSGGMQLSKTLKEHTGQITSIMVAQSDEEAVSSSVDGTCICWDLNKGVRQQIIFANTLFQQVRYRPDEAQLLTVGTDHKAAYWEVFNGECIREIEISETGAVNGVDISASGEFFVAGGQDKIVKIFTYKEGIRSYCGVGHSGNINRVKFSPGEAEFIVSVSNDGAILIWKSPVL